ncbi:MAG: nucleotide exchange factor GrpE [Gammaproteobacteria bacterium]|jgi:molecular chaperone GrpE|nr:nucleotide exchange factor GrpE [Gammaproteobacteria bacterium]MBT4811021.1 nucleotide exchange factor GrpE [Thiotrichales bacterium]MBT3473509.1 nucleotide exchange factor GrpE [Gammaproteobacteria bacterium]MBT4328889.1 nucleotide exchange factor GrpE [Gammaproteobacteria bacterium]MBT5636657.1 nucleotide exchange factor GrpE [Gammaproteobacteria bacterium]
MSEEEVKPESEEEQVAEESTETVAAESDVAEETTEEATEATVEESAEEVAEPTNAEMVEQAKAQAADYLDRMTRMQAEMDNLRKRTARDVSNARKFALEPFAKELLAVADSIDLGLNAAKDSDDVSSLIEGMELTRKQLFGTLEKFNVEVMDAMGVKFDPEQHEAMTMVPNPEMEPNTVMDVIQKGYTLNGRLLRPARVIVSSS